MYFFALLESSYCERRQFSKKRRSPSRRNKNYILGWYNISNDVSDADWQKRWITALVVRRSTLGKSAWIGNQKLFRSDAITNVKFTSLAIYVFIKIIDVEDNTNDIVTRNMSKRSEAICLKSLSFLTFLSYNSFTNNKKLKSITNLSTKK